MEMFQDKRYAKKGLRIFLKKWAKLSFYSTVHFESGNKSTSMPDFELLCQNLYNGDRALP